MKPYTPGPVGALILEALAKADDGLTINALTEATGRPPEQCRAVGQAIRVLERNGCVRVLTRVRRPGNAAAVWGVTTAGRAVLAQPGEVAAP